MVASRMPPMKLIARRSSLWQEVTHPEPEHPQED